MIPIDEELRYDGPISRYQVQRPLAPLEYQEADWLNAIRERREAHTRVIAEWKQAIAEHDSRWADRCLAYAGDLRRLVHSHAGNVRLVRQQIEVRAALANAKGEGE